MLLNNTLRENILICLFVVFASCLLGSMIMVYDIMVIVPIGLVTLLLIIYTRIDYIFYFLLASRSIVDAFFNVESGGHIRITHLLGAFVGVIFIIYFMKVKYNVIRLGVNKFFLSFMGISVLPIFLTSNMFAGFADWFKLLQGFLFINLAAMVVLDTEGALCKKRMNIICWCMIMALLLPSILFLKNYFQGVHVEMGGIERYSTFGSVVNTFSYYLLAVFPICLFFYSNSVKKSEKIFWFVVMAILLFFIYKTYTRNVWIGIAILIFAWNLIRKNFKIIFCLLGVSILLIIFDDSVQDRFKDIFVFLEGKSFYELDPRLLSNRIGIWQENLRWFFQKSTIIEKLFGNGFDIARKIPNPHPYGIYGSEAHNNYLALLMNTGIFGLVTYCLYISCLVQESLKLLRRTKDIYFKNLAQIFMSVVFTYIVVCFFTHMIWKVNFQYFFSTLAGLVIAANILEEKNAS